MGHLRAIAESQGYSYAWRRQGDEVTDGLAPKQRIGGSSDKITTEVVGKLAGRKGSLLSHLHDLQLRGRAPSMVGADDVPRHRLCGKERAARLQPADDHSTAADGRPPHPDAPAAVGRVCAGDPGAAAARDHGERRAARAQGAGRVHQVGAHGAPVRIASARISISTSVLTARNTAGLGNMDLTHSGIITIMCYIRSTVFAYR